MTTYPTARPLTLSEKFWRVNWVVVLMVALISSIGVVALYSAAGGSAAPWADKHALRAALGIGLIVVLALVPLRAWLALAYPTYAVALALLILVPLMGTAQMGARRWITLGPLSLQPSEIMKIGLLLSLARYYHTLAADRVSQVRYLLLPLAMIALPMLFVLRQPDLGTAVLFAVLGFAIMFLAGVKPIYFAGAAFAVSAAAPLVWLRLHDYQKKRIFTFLDPNADPLGAGYHIIQAKIALGSGGFSGKGFLAGTQSKLDFLPEKQTDFIFTSFAEETGFIGAALLLAAYAFLIFLLLSMALRAGTMFARLVGAGVALMLGLYVVINVGMTTGLVPVVGVPLPLVSYGGTAMTSMMVAIGLAMCAFVHRNDTLRS